jgi:hypothetical protein
VTRLPDPPARIAKLPRDRRGYPVPWFVEWIDGQPDFRYAKLHLVREVIRDNRCWICGQRMGRHKAYVLGPMCAVNRTSAEPPSHIDCGEYAAQACPFLTNPKMHRVEATMREGTVEPAGRMIRRNPGVALVWGIEGKPDTFQVPQRAGGNSGLLFDIGEPSHVSWWAHGRPATRDEVTASIDSGLPLLEEMAAAESPKAVAELQRMHETALTYLPTGVPA